MIEITRDILKLAIANMDDESSGVCLKCGCLQGGVEPDARQYECEECGARAVYGCEEIILMGA